MFNYASSQGAAVQNKVTYEDIMYVIHKLKCQDNDHTQREIKGLLEQFNKQDVINSFQLCNSNYETQRQKDVLTSRPTFKDVAVNLGQQEEIAS